MSAIVPTPQLEPLEARTPWHHKALAPGVTALVGGIAGSFFGLLTRKPESAMEIVKSWGPSWFLGLVALAMVAGLMTQMLEIARDAVKQQRKVAEALGHIAEKDDRQFDEMRRMAQFSAQRSERMVEILSDQRDGIKELGEQMKEHGRILAGIPCVGGRGQGCA